VRLPRSVWKWFLVVGLASAGLTLIAWSWLHWRRANSIVASHSYQLQAARMNEWKAVGGSWEIVNGVLHNNSYERGAKLLTGSSSWRDYTLNADIRFEGDNADMGVILRSNDEKEGTDTYNGYYVGLRTLDGTMVIGRSDFGWREARPVQVPGGVHTSVWYRLRVTAYRCNIAASVQNLTTLQTSWIAFEEFSCLESGRIGLRSLNAGGMWRNISITRAGWNDYLELRQHAASVEHPEVLPTPPWWTPWHAGMLFGGTLVLALLTQLAYFRIQQWKAYTITHERERLAHDIHDTMAQSFAGIGYQIQGIRHSVVRGNRVDSGEIADQLSVAYQLVRRCHEEASRTIAMLGSSSPPIQQNLLGALAETAHKIASDQIRTIVELRGDSAPLNLRLADALLHIGREAIVNAVSHSDPTMLTITLSCDGNNVDLMIEDNGRGFEYTPERVGFGILGMQKKAADVGGALHILSTPGHGTRVQVTARLHRVKLLQRIIAWVNNWFRGAPADFVAH
jgi:signal transduction histidine kinase